MAHGSASRFPAGRFLPSDGTLESARQLSIADHAGPGTQT